MAILGVLLNSTVIELATGVEADIDRELRMQGLANVASALAGGFVGTVHVTGTLINRAAGGTGRLSGVVAGLVALAVLIGGGQVVGYVPRFVLGVCWSSSEPDSFGIGASAAVAASRCAIGSSSSPSS